MRPLVFIQSFTFKLAKKVLHKSKKIIGTINFLKKKNTVIANYEENELISLVIAKSVKFANQVLVKNSIPVTSLRTVLPFALGEFQQKITVLDYGGAGGQSFVEAKYLFPETYFNWIVLETKGMVGAAKIADLESNELKFTENFSDIEKQHLDLVIANSSLQYTSDPIESMKKISKLRAKYIYIARMPLSENNENEFVRINQISMLWDNGPQVDVYSNLNVNKKVQIPAVIVSKALFEQNLEKFYKIKTRIVDEKQSFAGSGLKFNLFGYFCESKIF